MNYTEYVDQIATMAVVPSNDPNFQTIIPQMINYAELRIQRDLDLFAGQFSSSSYSATAGSDLVQIQEADFITIQSVSIQTGSTRNPLLPVTKEWLQYVYPVGSTPATPKYFSMYTTNVLASQGDGANVDGTPYMYIRLGPIPDSSYGLTITGTLHLKPLSADNDTTWISTYLPDLFIMASMVYVSAYQRNFGKVNDDPAMAQTYEGQYLALLNGAKMEEFRKKFQASAWTSMSPSPVATPSR
jgi:hypothetical protein